MNIIFTNYVLDFDKEDGNSLNGKMKVDKKGRPNGAGIEWSMYCFN